MGTREPGNRLAQLPLAPSCRAVGEGVEYLLADSQPPHLFILRKMYRHALGAITTLAFYYILDGTIYQAPPLQAALLARMASLAGLRPAGPVDLPSGWRGLGHPHCSRPDMRECSQCSPAHRLCSLQHASRHTPPPSCTLQQRCMFCIKGAFQDMQQDLSPLSQLVATQAGQGQQKSTLERALAAGRDVARAVTAADREQQQRVEANVRHVLRQVRRRLARAGAACSQKAGLRTGDTLALERRFRILGIVLLTVTAGPVFQASPLGLCYSCVSPVSSLLHI